MKKLLYGPFLAMSLMSCAPSALLRQVLLVQNTVKPVIETQVMVGERLLNQDQLQDFLIQQSGNPAGQTAQNWRQAQPAGLERTPELSIQDIRLAETGQSIMGAGAPAAIEPLFQGKTVELILTGHFSTKQDKALKLKTFLFTLEAPLIHQSVAPDDLEPVSRILLDDTIPLTPVSVTEQEIRARIDTRGLVDLMLAGQHKLSLIHRRYYTDTLVRVARPAIPPGNLVPEIQSVEIIRNASQQPRFIKCLMTHAMTHPKFAYATIDGTFSFGYQTQILNADEGLAWEVLLHIPDPASFDSSSVHALTYSTPFGTVYRQF